MTKPIGRPARRKGRRACKGWRVKKRIVFVKFVEKSDEKKWYKNFAHIFLVRFSQNFDSLPMMFGSNLKRREVIRCLEDAFGGCSAGIRRLGKKIGCRKIWVKIKSFPISLPSLRIPAEQPPNASARHLVASYPFRLLPNIIGNE